MFIDAKDEAKLEVTKGYQPRELTIILDFLECGMFYDKLGRPYSRESLNKVYERSVRGDFRKDNNGYC